MHKQHRSYQIKLLGIKALKSSAQTAVALISTSALMSDVKWAEVLSASLLSGILAILIYVSNLPDQPYSLDFLPMNNGKPESGPQNQ